MGFQQNELLTEFAGGILTLVLNRPKQRNALTFGMYQKISELCQRAGTELDEQGIRVIVISGAGEEVLPLALILASSPRNLADGREYEARIEAVITSIETCRVPVIAAVAWGSHWACDCSWQRIYVWP